jgi:hypothetical protein
VPNAERALCERKYFEEVCKGSFITFVKIGFRPKVDQQSFKKDFRKARAFSGCCMAFDNSFEINEAVNGRYFARNSHSINIS